MKISPTKSETRGTRNAARRLVKVAPPNKAIAPTGAKFQGCGSTRAIAAKTIMATSRRLRACNQRGMPGAGSLLVFIHFLLEDASRIREQDHRNRTSLVDLFR